MSYPDYTRAERLADGAVHIIGVTAATAAVTMLFWIMSEKMGWPTFIATVIYTAALLLMLSASAAYHLGAYTAARPLLRRVDHAAIYLKIAGSFTPLAAILGSGFGYLVLGLVWGLALAGAATKLLAERGKMTTAWWPQVALAWLGVAMLVPLWGHLPAQSLWLILVGGLIYTGAVVFYCWESLRFANAIWHACVLLATGCMFLGISSALANALQVAP